MPNTAEPSAPPRTADGVLAALDPEQRAAASALRGPVCILAGAGTGKTRAITHRIAHGVLAGVYVPQQVLAVTFTTRAAGEMRARLRALGAGGVQARTFHSAALRQLQYFWPRVVGGELPRIESSKAPIVASAASRLGVRPGQAEVRDLSAEIEWAKVCQLAPADYAAAAVAAGRTPPAGLDPKVMADVYAAYEDVKRGRGIIDMEDILLLAVGVLADNDEVATTVRGQYRHLVVDEYQDVSPLQHRLLSLWLGDSEELCVVGDPSQTIYSFAGATSEYLLGFKRRYPGAEVVRLVRNYRSTPQVVHVANTVLAGGAGGAPAGVQLQAQRPAGPPPALTGYPDDVAEAEAVAESIVALRASGVPASGMAVLFRTNGQSLAYEQALRERGVPYVLKGGERFFERPEVRQARVLLRGAARSAGFDAGPGEPSGVVEEVRAVLAGAGLGEAAGSGATGGSAARDRSESLAALVRIAEDMAAADPTATMAAFVAELDERAADSNVPVVEGVTLASLHAAKGLEWDAVFLVGLVEGMVPITYAETPEEIEEERRLLYVGITRARLRLSMSWAAARSPGGRGGRRPSRFLDELLPASAVARPAAARTRTKGGARCRVCGKPLADPVPRKLGRCVECPADVDAALFDRLKAWRLERSKEQSLPAFCVFTDATLLAIAETVPQQVSELAAIPGVGKAKLDRYGPGVLAICAGEPVADEG